jgi:hypothetical protein
MFYQLKKHLAIAHCKAVYPCRVSKCDFQSDYPEDMAEHTRTVHAMEEEQCALCPFCLDPSIGPLNEFVSHVRKCERQRRNLEGERQKDVSHECPVCQHKSLSGVKAE